MGKLSVHITPHGSHGRFIREWGGGGAHQGRRLNEASRFERWRAVHRAMIDMVPSDQRTAERKKQAVSMADEEKMMMGPSQRDSTCPEAD